MTDSLYAFMKGIIDYAGLFPPAKLPLDISIRNFADYRKSDDAWMLSRFIIPWSRLEELGPYREEFFAEGPPFDFSVLGSEKETIPEFLEMMDAVAESCEQFGGEHGDRVTTSILETKLPAEAAFSCDRDLLKRVMDDTGVKLARSGRTPARVFYETFFEKSWKRDVETALGAIVRHNEERAGEAEYHSVGFKLRCGGVEAEMFPTLEQVAFTLNRARDHGVAVKCTAGLHHPVRLFHESVQTKMHGFFNVFGGALLAHAHDLTDEELQEILREEDPEAFLFADDSFSWNGHSISTDKIEQLREEAMISFGSCSFDEPREDLKMLGLL